MAHHKCLLYYVNLKKKKKKNTGQNELWSIPPKSFLPHTSFKPTLFFVEDYNLF